VKRWIIHVDMDAFFAAVEQRDNPELRGKPVIVGGLGRRGVVSTASYEARKFGIHSAMPMAEARQLCPKGIFLAGDHSKYVKVSADIQSILADFSPAIEPLSLDEAFLDVSGMEWLYPKPQEIAVKIKRRIKKELGLVASAGVAPNKFLAKLASDYGKPDGLVVVEPGMEKEFLRDKSVGRLWGVGATTAELLCSAGINTIGQLAKADRAVFEKFFGSAAAAMRALVVGADDRPVVSTHVPKSMGNEITFEKDLVAKEEMEAYCLALSQKVGRRLRKADLIGRTVTVKIRLASFKTLSRSHTLDEATCLDEKIYEVAKSVVSGMELAQGVRLLGITVTNLKPWMPQISLFGESEDKRLRMLRAMDSLKDRFGETAITSCRLLGENKYT